MKWIFRHQIWIFIAVSTILFPYKTNANPYDLCNSKIAKQIISGCSELIRSGSLNKENLALVYGKRSLIYIQQKNYTDAISDLFELLELVVPRDTEVQTRLAMVYALRGEKYIIKSELKKATSDFEFAYKLQTENASFKKRLLDLYELNGDNLLLKTNYTRAVAAYSKAIAIENKNAELYVSRAESYSKLNNFTNALADLSKAIEINSDLTKAYQLRAKNFLATKNVEKAIADYDEVLSRTPKNINVLLLRAIAYEKNIAPKKSLTDYRSALKINSKNKEATAGIKRLQIHSLLIAKQIQIELKMAKCYTGKIDGKWGAGSRKAMRRFAEQADFLSKDKEASFSNLNLIRSAQLKNVAREGKKITCIIYIMTFSTSFNCNNATNTTERTICNSAALAVLDIKLQAEYDRQLHFQKILGDRGEFSETQFRRMQRTWLQKRNQCADNIKCLILAYKRRLKVLVKIFDYEYDE